MLKLNEYTVQAGAHLGKMREWIQWHCVNGSDVIWGSNEQLRSTHFTVREMELLATQIAIAAVKEERERITAEARFKQNFTSL